MTKREGFERVLWRDCDPVAAELRLTCALLCRVVMLCQLGRVRVVPSNHQRWMVRTPTPTMCGKTGALKTNESWPDLCAKEARELPRYVRAPTGAWIDLSSRRKHARREGCCGSCWMVKTGQNSQRRRDVEGDEMGTTRTAAWAWGGVSLCVDVHADAAVYRRGCVGVWVWSWVAAVVCFAWSMW